MRRKTEARKEIIMSTTAIGAIGTFGAGSLGGMGTLGGMAKILPFPGAVANIGSAVELASPPSSTRVDISAAAKTAAAADGEPAGQSMSELAQALIVALLLQMLEKRPTH
jgi:hypothetical protein